MSGQRHRHLLAALGTAILVLLGASSAVGDEIRIWPHAVLDPGAEVVRLRDVADLRGFPPELAGRLARLVVSGAPRPGAGILVRAGDLRAALAEARINLGATRVFGASRCRVSRPRPPRPAPARLRRTPPPPKPGPDRTAPDAGTLEARLRDYILARLPKRDGRLEIAFSRAGRRDLALGGPDYRFEIRSRQERLDLGLLSFDVEIRRAGRPARTVTLVADVQLLQYVVVARRPINHGQVISRRDLKVEERGFSSAAAVGLTDLAAAVGLQSKRFLRPGDMLMPAFLEARPLVERGDPVQILVRGDGLEIKTSGKAQSSGALGEIVTVRRDGARRKQDLIEAVVAGPGLVTYGGARRIARR